MIKNYLDGVPGRQQLWPQSGLGLSVGYSEDQYNPHLTIIGSGLGAGTAHLQVVMQNLTRTLNRIARSTSRAIRAQHESLDSLDPEVLNSNTALDYLLTAKEEFVPQLKHLAVCG